MIQQSQVFLPVTFNKTFDNKGNYYVITAEVTNDTSKSMPAVYVERHDRKIVLTKEELEDEFNRMIQYVGSNFTTEMTIQIKRYTREYLNTIL